jgi:acyl-coenzyme A thioesterase PaaI-like protein
VVRASSIDDLLGVRYLDQHTAEIDYHPGVSNGPGGTIQGGAQALLGEMAAERALAGRGPFTVNDLEIRYLNRVAVGPLVATAEVLAAGDDEATVRVPLVDRGNSGRLVSLVTAVCRRTVEESDEPARFA